jgi:hypothetical protein
MSRAGDSHLAPTNARRIVTLKGYLAGANLNAIQTKIATLRTALSKEGQVLYFHDGSAVRINNEVSIDSVDIPVQWGQYVSDYTIGLSYFPLDDVHKAPAVVSYGTYVFCDLGANIGKPIPLISQEYKVERQSPDADRESARVTVTLSGFFEEGSISANQTKLAALQTALATDGGTLVYGNFSQTVKVLGFNQHEDTLQRRIGYTVQFMYVTTARSNGVIKMSSQWRTSRVTQRYVPHLVPFVSYASVQLLCLGPQKIHLTGYVIADSSANASIAAQLEIAKFPSGGIEDPSSNVTEVPDQKRVDFSVEMFYPTPALAGGLYGANLA